MTAINARASADAINTACWMVLTLVWAVTAFTTKKSIYKQRLGQRALWALIIIAGALLMANVAQDPLLQARFVPVTDGAAILAAVLSISGLALTLWARATLGRNWSGSVTLKEGHELIDRGPYRFVRHPIYSGLLLMIAAIVLLRGRVSAIAGWLLIFAGLWIKLRQEEQLMLRTFPEQYAAYSRRVKRIIPFVL